MAKKRVVDNRLIIIVAFILTIILLVSTSSSTIMATAQEPDDHLSELEQNKLSEPLSYYLQQQAKYQKQLKETHGKITKIKANLSSAKKKINYEKKKKSAQQKLVMQLKRRLQAATKRFKHIRKQLFLLQKQVQDNNITSKPEKIVAQADQNPPNSSEDENNNKDQGISALTDESLPYQDSFYANQTANDETSPARATNLSADTSKQTPQTKFTEQPNDPGDPNEPKKEFQDNETESNMKSRNPNYRKAPIRSLTTIKETSSQPESESNKQYTLAYGSKLPQTGKNQAQNKNLVIIGLLFLTISWILSVIVVFKNDIS